MYETGYISVLTFIFTFFLIIRIINTCVVYCAHPLEYAASLFWALFWSTKFTVMKIRAAFI